jgi:Patatin-like phospholipase
VAAVATVTAEQIIEACRRNLRLCRGHHRIMVENNVTKPGHAKPFQLGLVLAGAISAGAYTAGVLDFLFQALAEWEGERGKPGVPEHRVVLKVIAGASAGAITGALGAIALARGLARRELTNEELDGCYPDRYRTHQRFRCVLASLHRTWVAQPAMVSGVDGNVGLLGTKDLAESPVLRSLFNASLLDEIKRSAIEPLDEQSGKPRPQPVPFVARRLHVYCMISNMRGIPFQIQFGKGTTYGMQTIGDRIHYVVCDLGSSDVAEKGSWVELDAEKASLPISVETLPNRIGDPLNDWDRYGTSALASGAFPIGLASRGLQIAWPHYFERRYPIDIPTDLAIRPNFPTEISRQFNTFNFESLDGGIVNNNPFDYAQFALIGGPAREPTNGTTVERAVVMVAPFPEPPKFLPEGSPSPALAAIVRALWPALLNQARFRASDLAPAVSERDFSRFLIAPVRRIPRKAEPAQTDEQVPLERYPIACGLLGGFGGFLEEKFRAHDFQLGRRNCQQFLRRSFIVAADNAIVGRPGNAGTVPVIPLLGTAADPVPLPRWPQMTQQSFEVLCERMTARIDAVAPRLIRAEIPGARLRTAMRLAWTLSLRARVIALLRATMLADLVRRRQIAGWDTPDTLSAVIARSGGCSHGDAEAVIAELAGATSQYRTARSIAARTHLPENFVTSVLDQLCDDRMAGLARCWKDEWGYTLFTRRPSLIKRFGPIRWFNRLLNKPTVDFEAHDT